ncbi:unnamed protein product [Oppiella nova]|uniref:Major facilitator superfamily (MFS) profile domain-containing protein n=1 Tax=Oppiella nova TaxID=334625 RepID=A0A7R9QVH6_9ACAR|nr:unnamed protein product [Oppiella nova]CAG2177127.1 unnamed protein product [Oppiella nova]
MVSTPEIVHRKAPDGGWGWVVVFGSFMISLIGDGFSYTTGLFYTKFLTEYHESEAITSLFDSIMTGMIYCSGPVAGGLTTTYGCRKIAIIGSVITVSGMLSSIILDNIYTHCLTLGVITGTGLGLLYLPQVMIVTYWFDKRLSLATGIGVCGSGIGIAIFALLSDHLIETYGWKGAMLLLSGLMFSCVAFSSLFRKVDYMEEKSDLKTALTETFDFHILTDVVFVYFAFANFLCGAVYYVPIIFLKDHVVKTGIGTGGDAVNLMVFFGLSNAFGRAFFGYIADFPSLNRIILYGLSVLSYGVAIAPDGGWGWVVVFGSFMISVITDGFFYTSGLFYAKFLTEYHESEAITSLFDSIMMAMIYCSGISTSQLNYH